MGPEIVIVPLAYLGGGILVFLVFRVFNPVARPYALPTLVFSAVSALCVVLANPSGGPVVWFFFFFFLATLVFGAQAHVIKWLVKRRT